jgi:hypothetical protein
MTLWCARDRVPVRIARFGTSVEQHRQRSDRENEDSCDRRSYRPEHISILLDCDGRQWLIHSHIGHHTTNNNVESTAAADR